MELGYFSMPNHPPGRGLREGYLWDLEVLRWADELGYVEGWLGEHHTGVWEPNPAPDLLIAQAFRETKNIRLGPGGFCMPFHHPVELANRISMLDHMSEGRLNFGVAASSIPTDWTIFDVDGASGQHREMTRESLEIILKLWAADNGPFTYEGKYWKVRQPEPMLDGRFGPHLKPFQAPHPPIGVTGLSPNSETLKLAGEHGYIPLSLTLNFAYLKGHWDTIEAAAGRAGRTADRKDWRLVREVIVAETDAEAMKIATQGAYGRAFMNYGKHVASAFGFLELMKHSSDVADCDLTPEYMARHNWLVGSVETVSERIEEIYHQVGGFGHLVVFGTDYADQPEVWRQSMELLAREVAPRVRQRLGT